MSLFQSISPKFDEKGPETNTKRKENNSSEILGKKKIIGKKELENRSFEKGVGEDGEGDEEDLLLDSSITSKIPGKFLKRFQALEAEVARLKGIEKNRNKGN